MVTKTTTTTAVRLSGVLGALILALLIALMVPALAMADDAPAGVLDPPTLENPDPAAQAPPAQTGPVAEDTSGDPAPVVEPEPTAPPATTTPDPVAETPIEPATPPEAEIIPAPVTPPDVVITTPELVPTPAVGPDPAAGRLLPVVVIPPVNADAVPGRISDAVASVPGSVAAAAAVASSITLAAATDTPVGPLGGGNDSDPVQPSASAVSGLLTQNAALHQNLFTLNPDRGTSPVAPVGATALERVPGMPFGEEGHSTLFSESVAAPIGAVSSGSSLLAVLAGYVLPGVGGPPASTIIMFMLVGLIVALARAPRAQLSERLHMGALLGAASGHGLAVCRPG